MITGRRAGLGAIIGGIAGGEAGAAIGAPQAQALAARWLRVHWQQRCCAPAESAVSFKLQAPLELK